MSQRNYYFGARFDRMFQPGVKALLIANVGIFLLQTFLRRDLAYSFGLNPAMFWEQRALWQPVTYMFLHGGLMHLLLNMLVLWLFGGALESVWGTGRFLKYYSLTGVGAGLSNCILTPHLNIPIIGASGAVYGLLAAYGVLFPDALIYIYFLFPVRAKWLVLIFGGVEFIASIRPGASPVAHLVHLGGMVIGVLYLRWFAIIAWLRGGYKDQLRRIEQRRRFREYEVERRLRSEVDDLLDKINEVGMDNLTPWERRHLREASDRLKQMEENGNG